MPLFGPRLDSPSAIGDEGRPRAASLTVAAAVVAAVVGVSGVVLGWASLLPTLGLIVGLTAAGIGLLDRDGFADQLAGHAMLVPVGSILALLAVAAPFVSGFGLAVNGFVLALLGIAVTWADVGGAEGMKRTVVASAMTYALMLLSLVFAAILASGAALLWALLSVLVDQSGAAPSVVGFSFVTGCSGIAVLLSLRWLPIRQLTPYDRRPAVEDRLATLRRAGVAVVSASLTAFVLAILCWAGGWFGPVTDRVPGLETALVALSSRAVVGPIAAVGGAALLASALTAIGRRLAGRVSAQSARWLAAGIVGAALGVVAAVGFVLLVVGAAAGHPVAAVGGLVLAVTVLGPPLLALGAAIGAVGVALKVVPDRAAGPAVAAAGLILAAIGLGRGPSALVFACVAGAILVWDVSSFGLGVTAELGHLPETRRLELVHGVLVVGVGIVATLAAIGVDHLRTTLLVDVGATSALLVVALGAFLLLAPLRG